MNVDEPESEMLEAPRARWGRLSAANSHDLSMPSITSANMDLMSRCSSWFVKVQRSLALPSREETGLEKEKDVHPSSLLLLCIEMVIWVAFAWRASAGSPAESFSTLLALKAGILFHDLSLGKLR